MSTSLKHSAARAAQRDVVGGLHPKHDRQTKGRDSQYTDTAHQTRGEAGHRPHTEQLVEPRMAAFLGPHA